MSAQIKAGEKHMPPLVKTLMDFGPLVAFFIANWLGGIYVATGVLMVAIAIASVVSWSMTRRIAPMLIVTLVFVLIFGGLTLVLQDETFIKIKVTLVNSLFGSILLGGLYFGKSLVKFVMGEFFNMDETGWRKLSMRWGLFFFAMAGLNEVVWRSVSTDTWVTFKVFGLLGLTMVFGMCQLPLIQQHLIRDEDS